MRCVVRMVWDNEARAWYTDADDPLNLNLESGSFDALVERVRIAAPEMLELNCGYTGPVQIVFEVIRVDDLVSVL